MHLALGSPSSLLSKVTPDTRGRDRDRERARRGGSILPDGPAISSVRASWLILQQSVHSNQSDRQYWTNSQAVSGQQCPDSLAEGSQQSAKSSLSTRSQQSEQFICPDSPAISGQQSEQFCCPDSPAARQRLTREGKELAQGWAECMEP